MKTTLEQHFTKREKEIEKETINKVFFDAIKNNDIKTVSNTISLGADANAIFIENYPIEIAAQCSNKDMVKHLVEHGADVSVNDGIAFKLASIRGDTEMFKYLHKQAPGTNLDDSYRMACGSGNKDIMNYIESQQDNLNYNNAIRAASAQGNVEICAHLNTKMESKGIEYDKADCLKFALLKNQKESIDYFIDIGADHNKAIKDTVKSIYKPKDVNELKSNVEKIIFDRNLKLDSSTVDELKKYGCPDVEQMVGKKELNEKLVFRLERTPRPSQSKSPSMRMKI